MSNDLGYQEFAEVFGTELGLQIREVNRTQDASADAFVDGDIPGYAVEIKARCNRHDFVEQLEAGGPVYREEDPVFDGWYIRQAKDALKQLSAIDPNHDRLWLLWVDTNRRTETRAGFEQAMSTIFGVRRLVSFDGVGYECLHAKRGLFDAVNDLDAVVLFDESYDTVLCPNENGDRLALVEASMIHQYFASKARVITSRSLCELGYKTINMDEVDCASRSDVADYFKRQYQIEGAFFLDFIASVGNIRLDRDHVRDEASDESSPQET